ncbi:MAG: NADH:flavin oxidoreductase [Deltaproteobacteria bacterium]|jgi:2,4-dienoyl-CoA reductase-like NADH-dependent reductase (Old Yellow Enzyme family)|nr:NADH:flavin oxidoreductase [Deltaproteobacteria bacterium]MBT6433844.1 NADH:flavin oxidoreductase [Deltaproteobacteria bacterium]MBT6491357.1 NADH:flavin oxidoreductase [Deltaproteobacteria bacterium]
MHSPTSPKSLSEPLEFACGQTMKNRFMLAPMTNCQSHADGSLSDDEFNWLTMRAKGNFGLTMTCAAHVQKVGQGFPGQLGIYSDDLLEGHRRLAKAIRAEGSLAVIQLHHAGMRSPIDLIGEPPHCPSADAKTGSRALTLLEVQQLRDDFIAAAIRSQEAGYDGVEIHGAHGYILCQFLSSKYNDREDAYGGSLENRSRIIFEILEGVRKQCGPDFLVGIRLSPERFGIVLTECTEVSQQLIDSGLIDFIDISLWDSFKMPHDENHQEQSLLKYFAELKRQNVQMTVAGKIGTSAEAQAIMDAGIDFVSIGRAAILHHDYPNKVMNDPEFEPIELPATRTHLAAEGLSETFIAYMSRWDGFVEES